MYNMLFISPHPDDTEFCIGGFILKHMEKYRIMILNLSKGEHSKNGNVATRLNELQKADQLLNVKRTIHAIKDGEFENASNEVFTLIKNYLLKEQPSIVFCPHFSDKHPDHKITYEMTKKAINSLTIDEQCNIVPKLFFYAQSIQKNCMYFDISDVYSKKEKLMRCFKSQIVETCSSQKTQLNQHFFDKICAKDRYCGTEINCLYAEQIIPDSPVEITNIYHIL